MKEIILPGSEGEETSVLGSGGRLAADDVAILSQVAAWWRHRLTRGDAADAVQSLIGGVDATAAATTTNLTPATVALVPALVIPSGRGLSLLLHARGTVETMFLGAETIKPLIRRLVPGVEFVQRPRFSKLLYAGSAA